MLRANEYLFVARHDAVFLAYNVILNEARRVAGAVKDLSTRSHHGAP
jgi:hypothetical protein